MREFIVVERLGHEIDQYEYKSTVKHMNNLEDLRTQRMADDPVVVNVSGVYENEIKQLYPVRKIDITAAITQDDIIRALEKDSNIFRTGAVDIHQLSVIPGKKLFTFKSRVYEDLKVTVKFRYNRSGNIKTYEDISEYINQVFDEM